MQIDKAKQQLPVSMHTDTPPSNCLNVQGRFWDLLAEMNFRSEVDAEFLDAQCWMSSVTGFWKLQGDEIQNTGLRRSQSSGS